MMNIYELGKYVYDLLYEHEYYMDDTEEKIYIVPICTILLVVAASWKYICLFFFVYDFGHIQEIQNPGTLPVTLGRYISHMTCHLHLYYHVLIFGTLRNVIKYCFWEFH